ncbi:hypothetical protein Bbelb_064980 [Branchiostoma belcheri]|nr:hypothetical protein Bbelb_064980 [Branchiostoma belcheri]
MSRDEGGEQAIEDLTSAAKQAAEEIVTQFEAFPLDLVTRSNDIRVKYETIFKAFAKCHKGYSHTNSMTNEEISNLDCSIKHFLAKYRELFPTSSVSVKMHLLEEHVIPWIRCWGVGLGFHWEQGVEQVHAVFNWINRSTSSIPDAVRRLKSTLETHLLQVHPGRQDAGRVDADTLLSWYTCKLYQAAARMAGKCAVTMVMMVIRLGLLTDQTGVLSAPVKPESDEKSQMAEQIEILGTNQKRILETVTAFKDVLADFEKRFLDLDSRVLSIESRYKDSQGNYLQEKNDILERLGNIETSSQNITRDMKVINRVDNKILALDERQNTFAEVLATTNKNIVAVLNTKNESSEVRERLDSVIFRVESLENKTASGAEQHEDLLVNSTCATCAATSIAEELLAEIVTTVESRLGELSWAQGRSNGYQGQSTGEQEQSDETLEETSREQGSIGAPGQSDETLEETSGQQEGSSGPQGQSERTSEESNRQKEGSSVAQGQSDEALEETSDKQGSNGPQGQSDETFEETNGEQGSNGAQRQSDQTLEESSQQRKGSSGPQGHLCRLQPVCRPSSSHAWESTVQARPQSPLCSCDSVLQT